MIGRNLGALVVTCRAEAPGDLGRFFRVARHRGDTVYASGLQLCSQVMHRIGELGEDNDLFPLVLTGDEACERIEFGIPRRFPVATLLQHSKQGSAIGAQTVGELRLKALGVEPAKPLFEWTRVLGIDFGCAPTEIGLAAQSMALLLLMTIVVIVL